MVPIKNRCQPRRKRYAAGVDASGGGADAFTLSICHYEDDLCVQDVCRGWKTSRTQSVDLEGVVNDIAAVLKRYGLRECHGDKYAANWVVESFRRAGITYRQNPVDKSVYYLEVEPKFATSKIHILDHPELARELRLLERRPRPGGKTIVDHPRNSSRRLFQRPGDCRGVRETGDGRRRFSGRRRQRHRLRDPASGSLKKEAL
jgi:hypothetical protein